MFSFFIHSILIFLVKPLIMLYYDSIIVSLYIESNDSNHSIKLS